MAMKLGTESKAKVIIVVVLGLIVVGLIVWDVNRIFFSSPSEPSSPPASATTAASPSPSESGNAKRIQVSLSKLNPTLHPELMAQAESIKYTGSGRNIFSMNSAPPAKIEAVKGPVRPHQKQAAAPTGPPPPPPIDLRFFGYEAYGNVRKAFLIRGNNIYIASEGDVVDHRYKIVKILPFSIQITDLLYKNTQSLPLARS
jgi:hypothetical protein